MLSDMHNPPTSGLFTKPQERVAPDLLHVAPPVHRTAGLSEQETRVANDGKHYTWDQFEEYYPDDTNWYWDQAGGAPVSGLPAPVAPPASGLGNGLASAGN